MEKNQNDRRYLRSENLIRTAFIDLVYEKGYDKVKISDIVTRAKISRGTFYLHFDDKDSLLEQIENDALEALNSFSIKERKLYNLAARTDDNRAEFLYKQILKYYRNHRKMMIVLLSMYKKPDDTPTFREKLYHTFSENYDNDIYYPLYPNASEINSLSVPWELWTTYLFNARMGVVEFWLKNGCKETIEDLSLYLSRLVDR